MVNKKYQSKISLVLGALTLMACSLFSTPTSTPAPSEPTPTPVPAAIIAQANSTFIGTMTISSQGTNASANGGEIEFKISSDGTAIESLSYSLVEGKCTYSSGSSTTTISGSSKSTLFFNNPIPITNGKFQINFMGIQATGNLNSPSEADGEITINKEESTSQTNQKFICGYGTWDWSASAR